MVWRAQGREPERAPGSALAPWLGLAAAGHVALLLAAVALAPLLSTTRRAPLPAPRRDSETPAAAADEPLWLELISAVGVASGAGGSTATAASAAAAPTAALARELRPALVPELEAGRRSKPGPVASEPEPSDVGRSEPTESRERVADDSDGAAQPGASGPQLSLRELGIERGQNPFIGSFDELPSERQLSNQRLRHSLRSDIARQDQKLGLGPEGPAVRAVTEIVMASAAGPNTTALLRVRTDGAGRVTLVELLDADRDADEWRRIADELVRALAARKLRVPAGSNGVSFQLRVVSRVQLPSGADPGLAIDLLGIPLKQGDGERSTKLSILSPVIQEIEVPDSNGLRVPVVSLSLIGGRGDLADIGAVARRLVRAYLVAMDTNFPSESGALETPAPVPAATP